MTKTTAEQVLAHFKSLSRDQKQFVYSQIVHLKRSALARARHTKRFDSEQSSYDFPVITTKQRLTKKKSSGYYQLLMDGGKLIDFKKGYLEAYNDLWMLKSLVGSRAVMQSLNKTKRIDDTFVENLIKKCKGEFFIDQHQTYLFATTNELFESKFGHLESISSLDALKKYGLQKMEEANEKNYSKI